VEWWDWAISQLNNETKGSKMKIKSSMIIAAVMLMSVISLLAGEARVTLNWTARPANENVLTYIVSEQLSPGLATIGHFSGPPVVINNVSNGRHDYIVSGFNSFGEGIPSQSISVNIYNYPSGSPGIPANLTASVFYSFP